MVRRVDICLARRQLQCGFLSQRVLIGSVVAWNLPGSSQCHTGTGFRTSKPSCCMVAVSRLPVLWDFDLCMGFAGRKEGGGRRGPSTS